MVVASRKSDTMGVVRSDQRSAAACITGVARTIGASISPLFVGIHVCSPLSDQRALLYRGNAENHLRPLSLQGVCRPSAAGGSLIVGDCAKTTGANENIPAFSKQ